MGTALPGTVVTRKAGAALDQTGSMVALAAEESRYLTGNTLFVDGGSHINGSPWAPDLPDD